MTADEYLQQILAREAVDVGPHSAVRQVQSVVQPIISEWAGTFLQGITPSGSFAKGTANRSGTDIDLFISLASGTPKTLKEIYESLAARMTSKRYSPKRQNVSINIRVNGFDVDLVPARRQDSYGEDHSLYRRKADTWTKTNVTKHIDYVRRGGRIGEIRIIKLWRDQHGLDFPSFYLELTVIDALAGRVGTLSSNVFEVFAYLRGTFSNARVLDPANANNVVSEDLSAMEKAKLKAAAARALTAKDWNEIVQ